MQEYEILRQLVADVADEVASCEAGNKAAGTRVRKQMQEIKKAAQVIREKVLSMRQAPPPPQA